MHRTTPARLFIEETLMRTLFSLLLLLPGCLTVGEEFNSQVSWIATGKTIRADIDRKMGAPFRVGYDSGLLTYTYGFYRYSIFRPTRTKDLTIRFRADGLVDSYSFGSSFDEDRDAMRGPK
jgi:hypothetical protein